MIKREYIGTAYVPGGEELVLYRHGADFMIVMGNNELMNTRMSGSEEALARMTIERLGPHGKRAHLLVGGYGMGFTLRTALQELDNSGRVTVAELVPGIIDWARGAMAEVTAGCLDDPRVRLVEDDVFEMISRTRDTYDGILLDVDNGPDGLTRPGNNRLYAMRGLKAAWDALRPGGILAIWSAARDPAFTRRLENAGFQVDERGVRARSNGKGAHHVIWFARRS